MPDPDRNTSAAQLGGAPRRHYYTGRDLRRAVAIEDLRAMTHKRMPRFALEYLEAGAEEEATLARERRAYAKWLFTPRQLVDVSHRSLGTTFLGKPAAMPVIIAPTGLNGVFTHHADIALAQAAAKARIPFVQSTMSNDRMEDVAKIAGLRHWWQLYVFGGDEVWQELVRRADATGCEALVLTTNAQIFGNREWSRRTQTPSGHPSLASILNASRHPGWLARTMLHGMPCFRNVIDFIPKDKRGFFDSAHWIRANQPTSLSWDTVAKIRTRWRKPFLLKGILNVDDVTRAIDAGVDGVVLSSHGGRQLDGTIAPLELLPKVMTLARGKVELFVSGGLRRGTDLIKALALGASAVLAGRAPLYGLCAGGTEGVSRALEIIQKEAHDALGLVGAPDLQSLHSGLLCKDDG